MLLLSLNFYSFIQTFLLIYELKTKHNTIIYIILLLGTSLIYYAQLSSAEATALKFFQVVESFAL